MSKTEALLRDFIGDPCVPHWAKEVALTAKELDPNDAAKWLRVLASTFEALDQEALAKGQLQTAPTSSDRQKAEAALQVVAPGAWHGFDSCPEECDDYADLVAELNEDEAASRLFLERGCWIYHVTSPEGHLYSVNINWVPLWRYSSLSDCIFGEHDFVGFRPVTVQCMEDRGKQGDPDRCPCNGGDREFYEKLRAALAGAGLDVTDDLVNFEGA